MKYRVLFSDVGNVLTPFFLERFTRNLSRLTGMPEAEVDARLYSEMQGAFTTGSQGCQGIHRGILLGTVSSDQYLAEVLRRLGSDLSPGRFWQAFRDVFEPNRRLVDLWNRLRREGKVERIILLSDADPHRLTRALEISGFEPDAIAVSYEVGQLKPHPEMYRHALKLADVPAQACLFVDDVDMNVVAAREQGIESFRYMYPQVDVDSATDILVDEFRHVGLLD